MRKHGRIDEDLLSANGLGFRNGDEIATDCYFGLQRRANCRCHAPVPGGFGYRRTEVHGFAGSTEP